jgi:hypothetical protein
MHGPFAALRVTRGGRAGHGGVQIGHLVASQTQPDPRMQPTGRSGATLRAGGAFRERARERRFRWARAYGPTGLQLIRLHQADEEALW